MQETVTIKVRNYCAFVYLKKTFDKLEELLDLLSEKLVRSCDISDISVLKFI